MENYIKKIVLIGFCSLSLFACDDSDKNNNTIIQPTPLSEVDAQSQFFFSLLSVQEDNLNLNYGFTVSNNNGAVTYQEPSNATLRKIAQDKNINLNEVKDDYLNAVYTFALNYTSLQNNEVNLRSFNNTLYNNYIQKTYALGAAFSAKRINAANQALVRVERILRESGLGLFETLPIDSNQIVLPILEDEIKFLATQPRTLRRALRQANKVCTHLEALAGTHDVFNTANISISECTPQDHVTYFTAYIEQLKPVKGQPISLLNIENIIKGYTNERLADLHVVSNNLLHQNGIELNVNSQKGMNMPARRVWVQNNMRNFSHGLLRLVLHNNLYENLKFKKRLIRLTLRSSIQMPRRERQLHLDIIDAIDRALINVRFDQNTFNDRDLGFAIGTSPVDGFNFQY